MQHVYNQSPLLNRGTDYSQIQSQSDPMGLGVPTFKKKAEVWYHIILALVRQLSVLFVLKGPL
jgi:hypothetical protein